MSSVYARQEKGYRIARKLREIDPANFGRSKDLDVVLQLWLCQAPHLSLDLHKKIRSIEKEKRDDRSENKL